MGRNASRRRGSHSLASREVSLRGESRISGRSVGLECIRVDSSFGVGSKFVLVSLLCVLYC